MEPGGPDPQMHARARRRFGSVVWALIGAVCCALVSGFEPNMLEEGIGLHVAQRLAQGERLYRDVLVFTGPFPFELLALLFRLAGDEVWVARVAVVAMHALASGAAFALASAARPGLLAHAAAGAVASAPILLFPMYGIYYYTTIAFHLSIVAAFCVLRGLRDPRWAALAGVMVAAIALSKQTIGLALALTLGLGLLLAGGAAGRARRLVAFAAGGAGVTVLALAYWAATGTLDDIVFGMISLPMSLEDSYDLPFVNFWPPGELSLTAFGSQTFYLPYLYLLQHGLFVEPSRLAVLATQLLFALPAVALLVSAARLATRAAAPALGLQVALGVAWLTNLVPRADWGHLVHVLPFALAQLCVAVPIPHRLARAWRAGEGLLSALVIVALAAGTGGVFFLLHDAADREPFSARVPLRAVSLTLRQEHMRGVLDFLAQHAQQGEAIFVPRAEPLLYFATNTRNPTPFPGVFPAMRETQQHTIIQALENVRYVVMSDVDQPAMTYYRDELPAVQAYFERFFDLATPFRDLEWHWLKVLERVPDRGETLIDLLAPAVAGRPFIRDATGVAVPATPFEERLATIGNRRPLAFPLGIMGGGIDFEIDVPERALFRADASFGNALALNNVYEPPPLAHFTVSIGRDGALATVAEQMLLPKPSQYWAPLDADLSAWAGERVTLRIEMERIQLPSNTGKVEIGCVGSPRIVQSPTTDAGDRPGR